MNTKQKLTKIFVLLALAMAMFLPGYRYWQAHHARSTPPVQPTITANEQASQTAATEPSEVQPPKPSEPAQSIVLLPDEAALNTFISQNSLQPQELKASPQLANAYIVDKPSNRLSSNGAQVVPRLEYKALLTPNDPIYPQWYTTKISAPTAWDVTTGSSAIKVAVIDTGFALSHEDLAGRWAAGGKDFANNDNDPSAGTTNANGAGVSHGTMVAGLVGATGNNGLGVAGTNWGAKILPLQALDDNGSGYTDGITAAVNYAVAQGVKVINLSLGSASSDPLLQTAINNALSAGVSVVAAAGNCGDSSSYFVNGCSQVGQMLYPAKYSGVIAVGASDQNDARASFSSYGAELSLLAPGSGNIRTTDWSLSNQTSLYSTSANGTSFSAPIVSGAIALLREAHSSLSLNEIATVINSSTDKTSQMNGANRTNQYGYGRLNAHKIVSLSGLSCPNNLASVGNIASAPTGGRVIRNHTGGSIEFLAITLLNNTGTGCIEAHTWGPNEQTWFSNVATNHPAANPADNEVISANTVEDSRSDLTFVKYRNTGSGKIEIHTWDPTYQHWSSNVATNHPIIDPANARVIAADTDGDGKDELCLVLYRNTGSGRIEVHTWNSSQQGWVNNVATIHPIIDPANARVIAADTDGDGKDEISLVLFRNTGSGKIEVHTWNPGQQSWMNNVATNHPIIDPANAEVLASDTNGDGRDKLSLVLYRNTGSGKIEVHTWNPGQQSWMNNVATNHPVLP